MGRVRWWGQIKGDCDPRAVVLVNMRYRGP